MAKRVQTEIEKEVLSVWKERNAFRVSNTIRQTGEKFVFYDGPPFATGTPHYGHILVSIIKDTIARYQNMCGKKVPRTFGWDCHGLPVESLAQKKMGITAYDVIKDNKVKEFNDTCRGLISQCEEQWKDTITRIGRWVDFDHSYKTMDINYMESVWWAFKEIYKKDRVYKSHRIMPYSGKLMTALSNFEVSDNYREVSDPAIVVKFKVAFNKNQFINVLVYTTTPWTLPANAALCVNPNIDYSIVEQHGELFFLATKLVPNHFKDEYKIVDTFKGSTVEGHTYESLFSNQWEVTPKFQRKVVCDEYVLEDSGTGVVHIAPAYGEDDYRVGKKYNLPVLDFLDDECKFQGLFGFYQFCKDEDINIVKMLKESKQIFSSTKIKHDYPYCDRTNSPLIYRAVDAWYIKIEDIKEKLLENNAKINWVPEAVGKQRFANWLKDAKDWNVSRNRLWGSCIPIWIAEDGEQICIGSIEELENLSGQKITDLHKEFIDPITFTKNGKLFTRTPEILDCWFESGAMPYAQAHFPFENVNFPFPADFVVEGLDQTRGWFYTLLILSTILMDKPPFKNVIVNGLILASDGQKMSKSKNNYTDPNLVIEKYGADPLRAYLLGSGATHGEPIKFDEKQIEEMQKSLIVPIFNAVDFYKTYAVIDNWNFDKKNDYKPTKNSYLTLQDVEFLPKPQERILDRWILSKLGLLTKNVRKDLDSYEVYKSIPRFIEFMDLLCNWYIRLSRKIFWEKGMNPVKESAYKTLHEVLLTLCKLLAPFCPFTTDHISREINHADGIIHFMNYPHARFIDEKLIKQMDEARNIAALGLKVRQNSNIQVKQPLACITAYGVSIANDEFQDIIATELNVESVLLMSNASDLSEKVSVKANFKTLGKKCGKDVNAVANLISTYGSNDVRLVSEYGSKIFGHQIDPEDLIVTKTIDTKMPNATENGITVILNTTITQSLYEKGVASQVRSYIQDIRKKENMTLVDRIDISFFVDEQIQAILENNKHYLKKHLLCDNITFDIKTPLNGIVYSFPIGGKVINIKVANLSKLKRAAAIFIIEKGKILACSRKEDHTSFGLPGGKCEEGESFEDAAERELYEETGFKTNRELHVVYERKDDEFYVKTFMPEKYFGIIPSDENQKVLGEGIVKWVTPTELINGSFGDYNKRLLVSLGILNEE